MPVKRKPQKVNQFISQGGSDPQNETTSAKEIQPIKLRIPKDLLEEIDAAVAARRPSPSRHQWLLEAIYEKLDRDSP